MLLRCSCPPVLCSPSFPCSDESPGADSLRIARGALPPSLAQHASHRALEITLEAQPPQIEPRSPPPRSRRKPDWPASPPACQPAPARQKDGRAGAGDTSGLDCSDQAIHQRPDHQQLRCVAVAPSGGGPRHQREKRQRQQLRHQQTCLKLSGGECQHNEERDDTGKDQRQALGEIIAAGRFELVYIHSGKQDSRHWRDGLSC